VAGRVRVEDEQKREGLELMLVEDCLILQARSPWPKCQWLRSESGDYAIGYLPILDTPTRIELTAAMTPNLAVRLINHAATMMPKLAIRFEKRQKDSTRLQLGARQRTAERALFAQLTCAGLPSAGPPPGTAARNPKHAISL
jgi:hypothetical protein